MFHPFYSLLLASILLSTLPSTHSQGIIRCPAESRLADCSNLYSPVCATHNNDNTPDEASWTAANPCEACTYFSIAGYTLGECPNKPSTIPKPLVLSLNKGWIEGEFCYYHRGEQCNEEVIRSVCALYTDCVEEPCHVTKKNLCDACRDSRINSYFTGSCRDIYGDQEVVFEEEEYEEEEVDAECPSGPNPVIISPNYGAVEGSYCYYHRDDVCTGQTLPKVCAVYKDCFEEGCRVTRKNACEACGDPDISHYFDRSCEDLFGTKPSRCRITTNSVSRR